VTLFLILAVLLTLAAGLVVLWPLLRRPEARSPLAAVAVALALPAFVLFSYLAVSNYDWARPPAPAPAQAAAGTSTAPLEEAVRSLEARLKEQPEDQAGWVLLGSSYTALGRADDAVAAYGQALKLSDGQNLDAQLGVAEAQLLKDRDALTGEAGATVEAVLAAAPDNPKALWYGGLVALARGNNALAERRWSALLALPPPPRIRAIVEAELAALRGEAGAPSVLAGLPGTGAAAGAGPRAGTGSGSGDGASGPAVTVQVTVSPAVEAGIKAGAPLFVFVRDAAGGPPLAVVRRRVADLPLTVRISDADVMIPGRSLGGVSRAAVTARVANGGDPVAKPGDVYGETEWSPGSGDSVAVVIDRTVQ
jgi:cytochrome c-type biogenesis protein CcmH